MVIDSYSVLLFSVVSDGLGAFDEADDDALHEEGTAYVYPG